ncbi:electron transfer flavoprotein subunit alpha/FixB family protein [Salinigranum salinum]|uniref:electron transfer flavoprotein subunit alpha/FixB family protein n=1 Tax=Salinigranum salinum TaxID=1364937 RepID=UPI001260CA09|nr:electron transfer flavoprotein subunit alpha/FixB family protein [Salinigranum salinum]
MVLVLVEHEAGEPAESSLETLGFAGDLAARLGSPLEAVVFGPEGAGVADDLGAYGVEVVHHVDHADIEPYAPRVWGESLSQVVDHVAPEAVLAPGSDRGHEVLAHVAALRDVPMAANCVAVSADDADGPYEITRQRWGGSLSEHATFDAETRLMTVPPHEFDADPTGAPDADAAVEPFEPDLTDIDVQVRISRIEESDEEGVPLEEARVVVGGGRGVQGPENYDQLEELAELLGGTVGASRAAVNEGWRPHDDQIGLTGSKIAPDIYIACGISGAVQHMVGCKGAQNILAINTDPEAAIMQKAAYAVVGDLHEVIPAINEAIRARR